MDDDITTLVMVIVGMGVMRVVMIVVDVHVMRVHVLRRCRSGDGERQRRHPGRRPGQKKSAEWHETNSFSLVCRYRSKWSFRVFSMAWYPERAPKIKLGIRRDPAAFVNAVGENFCIILASSSR